MLRISRKPTTRRIEIYLENLEQFFNSMDPSPFHEKDLDDDAEEFIVSWAEEFQVHSLVLKRKRESRSCASRSAVTTTFITSWLDPRFLTANTTDSMQNSSG